MMLKKQLPDEAEKHLRLTTPILVKVSNKKKSLVMVENL
jgi:hypothetical protein